MPARVGIYAVPVCKGFSIAELTDETVSESSHSKDIVLSDEYMARKALGIFSNVSRVATMVLMITFASSRDLWTGFVNATVR